MVYRRCIERVNGFTNQQTLITWEPHLVGKKNHRTAEEAMETCSTADIIEDKYPMA